MNRERVEILLKFCLAAASENDFPQNSLGYIHLIKYLYLADLIYAETHNGETFTGVEWKFHHFGPWNPELFRMIEPVFTAAGANKHIIPSKYENDTVRWSLEDQRLLDALEQQLPFEMALKLKSLVKEYANFTAELLHHVYTTPPMLKAAPGETLDFEEGRDTLPTPSEAESEIELTPEQERRLRDLRGKVRERLKMRTRQKDRVAPDPPVEYDEIFFKGQAWLDELAGHPIEPCSGELRISDKCWKSPARRGIDVS